MALKDQLNDALQATPADNTARQQTLRAVLAASGSGSDAEIKSALTRLISDREAKTATFMAAGKPDAARAERAEIDALRALLKLVVTSAPTATITPKKAAPAAAAAAPVEAAPKALLSKQQLLIGGLAVLIVAALAYYFLSPKSGGENGATSATPIVLRSDDRTQGNPKAKVIMVEYAAPTCPVCARFNALVMPHVKAEYIDTGKVFYVFRNFPLSATDGAVEGIARLCLPGDKYFQFLDLMFRNQSKWDPDGYQIPDVGAAVKQMAGIMGVAPEDADRCMTEPKEQERINQVAADGQQRYKIRGTPTIVVNGQVLQDNERTWPLLKARFDSLLAKKQ
jgi:protein-disulfide isomerase